MERKKGWERSSVPRPEFNRQHYIKKTQQNKNQTNKNVDWVGHLSASLISPVALDTEALIPQIWERVGSLHLNSQLMLLICAPCSEKLWVSNWKLHVVVSEGAGADRGGGSWAAGRLC